jgi:hypothetical protein
VRLLGPRHVVEVRDETGANRDQNDYRQETDPED